MARPAQMLGTVSGSSITAVTAPQWQKSEIPDTFSQVHSLLYFKHQFFMLQQELPDGAFFTLQPLVCTRHSIDAQHLHVSPTTSPTLLGMDDWQVTAISLRLGLPVGDRWPNPPRKFAASYKMLLAYRSDTNGGISGAVAEWPIMFLDVWPFGTFKFP